MKLVLPNTKTNQAEQEKNILINRQKNILTKY